MGIRKNISQERECLLDIVIINWHSKSQLITCLDSLSDTELQNKISITVVDNSSEIEDVNQISTNNEISLLVPERNLGFGGGCNFGASNGLAPYILFLNPDVIFLPKTVNKLLEKLGKTEIPYDVGIIGVQLLNMDGSVQENIANFPTFGNVLGRLIGLDHFFPKIVKPHYAKGLDYSKDQYAEQIPGAFFLVKREVFDQQKGFDEKFFMYYEDVDFSYRAFLSGWKTFYIASLKVLHKGGGTTESIKDKRLFYSLNSRVLYIEKHFGKMKAKIIRMGIIIFELPLRVMFSLMRKSKQDVTNTINAFKMFINLP